MDIQLFQQKLLVALQKPHPGKQAQKKMAVQPFRSFFKNEDKPKRKAGVLVLLFPEKGDWHIVLTERSKDLKNHRGQISFPGGVLELNESDRSAALREAAEEIGVNKCDVTILGNLTSLFVPVSGFTIFPIVGTCITKPSFYPNLTEVSRILFAPISKLLNEDNIRAKTEKKQEIEFTIPYFFINGEKIWGATAMILAEFLEIVSMINYLK